MGKIANQKWDHRARMFIAATDRKDLKESERIARLYKDKPEQMRRAIERVTK